ncbi:MAG: hypothetical protein KGI35_06595 [Burkholderiales bacterium]|nr:hypothetical protein [Burkholderiales bacterium]
MIDRDIHRARALVVESNANLRALAAAQLREAGVGQVQESARTCDARLLLEHEPFDIVVCNREFEEAGESGQDLLDELRREHLLSPATVFLMTTSRPLYHEVVEAAESTLDGLLVRPYSTALLAERLAEARRRKRELGRVLRALHAGQTELALIHAVKRFQERRPYWNWCGRLAAELMLTLQRPGDAEHLFLKLGQASPAAAWARLGQARSRLAQGDATAARDHVAAVLAADPESADAHDLMGRILIDQCDFEGALAEYGSAADLTPGCLLRSQHAGALAFYLDQREDALRWLERTLELGVQSKLFDALSLLLIAMMRFDLGDADGVGSMAHQMDRYRQRFPESRRLGRLDRCVATLAALLAGNSEHALAELRALATQAMDDDFDLEAASMTLAAWARMPSRARTPAEFEALVERMALRFCTSRAVAEALIAAGRREEAIAAVVRRCQHHVSSIAEQALDASLRGDPGAAAHQLLEIGETTLNARLLEMSGVLARRHESRIGEAQALAERSAATLRRSCKAPNHIAGIQRSGRSPGGLQLRGRRSAP